MLRHSRLNGKYLGEKDYAYFRHRCHKRRTGARVVLAFRTTNDEQQSRRNEMLQQLDLSGSFTFPGTSMTVNRMGYGAMQLAGPEVFGPPRDVNAAIAVLREAIEAGVNHIDTSDYYGPHVTNQIIKRALHPYPDGLVIVTKLGARRGDDKSWIPALSRQELSGGAHDNLRNLGLDRLDVVNLRVGGITEPTDGSIEEQVTVLADLKHQGLIRDIGLSNVTPLQLEEAQKI